MPGIDGIVSGLDTSAIIQGVMDSMRRPIQHMEITKGGLEAKRTAYRDLNSLMSDLESAVDALDSAGELGSFGVTSSQETKISATASGSAQAGTYDVRVVRLAENSIHRSRGYSAPTSQIANGTMTMTIAGQTTQFQVNAGNGNKTIAGLADYINDNVDGATAYVLDTGVGSSPYRLMINADQTGVANGVTLNFQKQGGGSNPSFQTANAAVDAEMRFGGLVVRKPTNTVTDLIPGLTLELQAPTSGAAKITVTSDPDGMADSVETFVDAYNAVADFIIEQRGSAETDAGPLNTDSTLRTIERRLAGVLGRGFATGQISGLNEIGIGTGQDGRITFDRSAFDTAVTDHYTDVVTMLSGTNGLFAAMNSVASGVTDPTTGLIEPRIEGLGSEIDIVAERIERQEARLEVEEERLRAQFTALELIMAEYQSTESFLTQQLESLNSNKK